MNPVEQDIAFALGAFLVMMLGCVGMALRQWWKEKKEDE